MASILDLPRELYLMVCSYLTPTQLTQLAGVSRDHCLAVQQPLFAQIRLTSYAALVRLVSALTKVPIVSRISKKQRLHWHKLSDAQLCEREISHLDLLLSNKKDGNRIVGAVLSRCIGAISRKCLSVKISLTLNGVWTGFAKQLQDASYPNVTKLLMFVGKDRSDLDGYRKLRTHIWDLVFSGTAFPDLRSVYITTLVDCAEDLPRDLISGR